MVKQKDQVSGAFFFLISLFVIQQSLKLGLGDSTASGPGLMPLIWGAALGVFSLATILKAYLRHETGASTILVLNWVSTKRLLLAIGALLFFTSLSGFLGFFFSIYWVMVILFRELRVRWWLPFLAAGATTAAGYFLFHVFIKIQFPKGLFGI
jgi:hypothetical protein